MLLDIRKMTISLNETTAHVHGNVSKLLTRIESAELGMFLYNVQLSAADAHR